MHAPKIFRPNNSYSRKTGKNIYWNSFLMRMLDIQCQECCRGGLGNAAEHLLDGRRYCLLSDCWVHARRFLQSEAMMSSPSNMQWWCIAKIKVCIFQDLWNVGKPQNLLKSAPFTQLEPPFFGFGFVLFCFVFSINPLAYILLQSHLAVVWIRMLMTYFLSFESLSASQMSWCDWGPS